MHSVREPSTLSFSDPSLSKVRNLNQWEYGINSPYSVICSVLNNIQSSLNITTSLLEKEVVTEPMKEAMGHVKACLQWMKGIHRLVESEKRGGREELR